MRVLSAVILAAALGLPAFASAQAANPGDVRCLLTMAAAASNPQNQAQALSGVYFFAARVTSQQPAFDFSKALRAEAEKMSLTDFQSEGARCATILQGVARNLQLAQGSLQGFTPKN